MSRAVAKRLFAVISVLVLLGSGLLAVPMAGAQVAGDPIIDGQYACRSRINATLRFTPTPSCTRYEELIDISSNLPFDFCVHRLTGQMRDLGPNDNCTRYEMYVVEDGTTGFYTCMSLSTGALYYARDPNSCETGTRVVAYVNLTGHFTKYVCTEDNLNPDECDFFPAGVPQNEIREIGPIPNTSGGFIDCMWTWEFDGVETTVQSCNNDSSNADIELALESLPGIDDVEVTGGPIAGTIDAPIRIEFVGTQAATDIVGPISINNRGSTIDQDDITIVDGSPSSPGRSYVMPGGTVQIWEADGATNPNDPNTYGPEVTSGPQPVDPTTGAYSPGVLVEGDYVVCATGTDAVSPNCELVTINGVDVSLVNNINMPGTISAAITDADGVNEVQSITQCSFQCSITGGDFRITFESETTGPIPHNATAAQVETALEGLTSIVDGDVSVTGAFGTGTNPGGTLLIEFQQNYAGMDVSEISANVDLNWTCAGLGCGFLFVQTETEGSNAVQTLTADSRVSGGTFTLSFGGSTTGSLDFDATDAEIAAALNALPSIGGVGGSVTAVGGPINQAPVEINFSNVPNADTNVLIVDSTNLT